MVSHTPTRRDLLVAALSTPAVGALAGETAATTAIEQSGSEWRMFQADLATTGTVSTVSGPAARDIEPDWSVDLGFPTGPVFTEDRIFAVGGENVVYAFDRATGDGLWRTDLGGENVTHTPALGHGQLYVSNGTVTALDTETGEVQWSGPGFAGENLLVRGDSVFTAKHRIDPANGEVRTTYGDFGPFVAACIAGGRLYSLSATYDSGLELYSHEIADGSRVWKAEFDHSNLDDIRAPAYRDGYVYVTSGPAGRVYAVDDVTGATRWSASVGADTVCSPAVTAERVILTARRGDRLIALNRDTGDLEWSTGLGETDAWGTYGPSPVVADGTVYVGSVADRCFAIEEATGETVWEYELDASCTTAPAVAEDTVYVAGRSLHAIGNTPNSPPSASIEYDPRPAIVDERVEFRGLDSTDDGSIEAYEWDLDGDGEFERSGLTATTTFTETGDYEVALRVTDNRGATDTARTTVTVADPNTGPTASFTATPEYPVAGEPMTFDASGSSDPDGEVAEYAWEIDDGGVVGRGPRLEHTFDRTGEHSVRLTVRDDRGAAATARRTVRVRERRAGFDLTGPDAGVRVGERATATLGVTNFLPADPVTVRLDIDTPEGVSIAGVDGADPGSGPTTAVTSVEPSSRTDLAIRLDVSEAGSFDIGVTATYSVADRTGTSQEFTGRVTVTGLTPTPTESESTGGSAGSDADDTPTDPDDGSDGAAGTANGTGPGFGVSSAIAGGALALRRLLGEEDGDGD